MSEEPTDGIDPIHEADGKWYFYNETWADTYGPYPTEREARHALAEYEKQM